LRSARRQARIPSRPYSRRFPETVIPLGPLSIKAPSHRRPVSG
jgi:hypothetical protein